MGEALLIILSTVLVHNFVLTRFLGLCPFLGTSTSVGAATGMAGATTFVLTLAAIGTYWIDQLVLRPFELAYLRTIAFIVVIAATVQLTEQVLRATQPLLYRVLGLYLPLITSNCAVLGVTLLSRRERHDALEAAVYGLGAGVGFGLVLVIFAGLRQRLEAPEVPALLRGSPIALVTAGILAMGFMGFAGFARL